VLLVTAVVITGALHPPRAVAAAIPTKKILVWSRANDGLEGEALYTILTSLGYEVTVSESLPSHLSEYASIWSVVAYQIISPTEQTAIETYVKAGGRLYLTGERPCCEELNRSDQEVVRVLLKNKAIVVGEQGDVGGPNNFNPHAADAITRTPNTLTEAPAAAPGGFAGIGNITGRNVVASNGAIPIAGAFDEKDMENGKGRVVLYMDVNWLSPAWADEITRRAVIENIETFLTGASKRPPSSAQYVALGDSFASGEGTFSYISGSKQCYRATAGYVEQVAADEGDSLSFAACAGATIGNIVVGKKAQLNQVGLDTRLITISVGGDDVGFSHVLVDCVGGIKLKGGTGCAGRDENAAQTAFGWLENGRAPGTYTLPGITSATNTAPPTSSNAVRLPSLSEVYEEIVETAAPGAHVVVVGYPELFETAIRPFVRCQVGSYLGTVKFNIAEEDIEWLDERANQLDEIIANQVALAELHTGANITFVDPRPEFYGGTICDAQAGEDINPALAMSYHFKVKPESFHPTQEGQNRFTDAILGVL
jgi:hypothetical protein